MTKCFFQTVEHEFVATPLYIYLSSGVVTGVFVGAIAAIRRQPAVQYAAHASVNASIIAAVYLGIRKSLLSNQLNHKRQMFPMDASMASGGVTGSIIGAIQSMRLNVVLIRYRV